MASTCVYVLAICGAIVSARHSAYKNTITSTSESGVCFYGQTAERVLNILATGKFRYLLHNVKGKRPRDCTDLKKNRNHKSGVYMIYPEKIERKGFDVYCDMDTDGGGWTVFQKRFDGKVNFYRTWTEYKKGFGNLKTEFWLGNDKLHRLTKNGKYVLRVDLEDFAKNKGYAKYNNFAVGNAASKYKLAVGGYSGTIGDSLTQHNAQSFTTKDQDNDVYSKNNCAEIYKGAWWYAACHHSNLNGLYLGDQSDNKGMRWSTFKDSKSMKSTTMMAYRAY